MSEVRPKVWVTQEGTGDYTGLLAKGELSFVTESEIKSIEGSRHTQQTIEDIVKFRIAFNPELDYLSPAGNPLTTAMMFVALAAKGVGRIRLAKWNSRNRVYDYFTLNLEDVMPEVDA